MQQILPNWIGQTKLSDSVSNHKWLFSVYIQDESTPEWQIQAVAPCKPLQLDPHKETHSWHLVDMGESLLTTTDASIPIELSQATR